MSLWGIIEYQVGKHLAMGAIVALVVVVALALTYGTQGLMALGLSRSAAGGITSVVVVAGCLAALGGFAVYGIDWD